MLGGCGAKVIKKAIQDELGIGFHNDELTPCKTFSYEEVSFYQILTLHESETKDKSFGILMESLQ